MSDSVFEAPKATGQSLNTDRKCVDFSKYRTSGDSSSLRNIRLGEKRTSVRLENEMWAALEEISRDLGLHLNEICNTVYEHRGNSGNFTSNLRVFIVSYYRSRPNKV